MHNLDFLLISFFESIGLRPSSIVMTPGERYKILEGELIVGEMEMKEEVFFGEGMAKVKKEYPELYNAIVGLNEAAYTGKAIDYKTQKLIALGHQCCSLRRSGDQKTDDERHEGVWHNQRRDSRCA